MLPFVPPQDEFEVVCFDFGVELDDVDEEVDEATGEKKIIYKIDIPANRYDLLCLEGIGRAMNVFFNGHEPPTYSVVPQSDPNNAMTVEPATNAVRPFVVCAILRGVSFDEQRYNSFIELQEKLHQNICRRRTLVAIGTHDLDTIQGPFTYTARKPADIKFVPLMQAREFDAAELMEFYRTDPDGKAIKPYTDIIYDSPVYPVIYDANGVVLSMPPIINGAHSKISLQTKNVFIECTATDRTKAMVVLNTVVTMFSQYASPKPFVAEAVPVTYQHDGTTVVTPELGTWEASANVEELNSLIGIDITPDTICALCKRMQLWPARYDAAANEVRVAVPPTRADILHACDVIEDVAIAYGYNNVARRVPPTNTPGKQLPVNQLTDLLRDEIAHAGFMEILTLGMCSHAENFAHLRRKDDGATAVQLANPKTIEFEVVRTSLLPGMLKTLNENKSMPIADGVRLFEISDVVLLDAAHRTVHAPGVVSATGARNSRRLAALFSSHSAGFEKIHGLVDRVMQLLSVAPHPGYVAVKDLAAIGHQGGVQGWYKIVPGASETFFPGMAADILYVEKRLDATNAGEDDAKQQARAPVKVGSFGVLHPEVLANFKLDYPATVLEMELEPFLHGVTH